MLFNSFQFLVFFPIVLVIYYIIPNRIKYIWLLIASYYFYMCWNAKYALLLLTSTAITYASGLLIDKISNCNKEVGPEESNTKEISNKEVDKKATLKKCVVACSVLINIGILFSFKYASYFLGLFSIVCGKMNIALNVPVLDIILPVGISFYTFQALSYTMDVYRGEIHAEKNFLRYALFVSFFPQLVAGPIERSKNLLGQLAVPQKFDFENARDGFLLMLWGYFLKVVLADRISIFVNTVYGDYQTYPGWFLIIATVLFSIQIYCDFAGYSTIAMGAAQILGIKLMENFSAPYLSTSVAVFWRRWHISLTSWFKDYLYIPLGGSRKGQIRKYINKFVVFLVSGLWHGANLSFVVWGALNGIYQIIGEMLQPVRNSLVKILHLNRESMGHRLAKGVATFVMVDFAWIFFRASGLGEAVAIVKSIFTIKNVWILFDGSLYTCGLDNKNFGLMIISILILVFSDVMKRMGICVREHIARQDYWCRYLVMIVAICFILIFGVWGSGYDEARFIYFQF